MLAPIVVGFLMATLGVALLFLGEVPFLGGRRISALRSRLVGGVLVLFLPVSFGIYVVGSLLVGSDRVDGPMVTWSLFSVCWVIITIILFRVLIPKRERRTPTPAPTETTEISAPEMSFGEMDVQPTPIEAPTKAAKPPPARKPASTQPTGKTPAKKAAPPPEDNPFDFS